MEIPGDKRLAAAVVMHEGRVLLVRRSETERFLPLVWGVPCGKLEPGESPEDGALRELRKRRAFSARSSGRSANRPS